MLPEEALCEPTVTEVYETSSEIRLRQREVLMTSLLLRD